MPQQAVGRRHFHQVIREGLVEKLTFEERLQADERDDGSTCQAEVKGQGQSSKVPRLNLEGWGLRRSKRGVKE